MAIQVDDVGVDWQDAIVRLENLPRGEAKRILFESGRSMIAEHYHDGTVQVRIHGDGAMQRIFLPNIRMLADILRSGVEQGPRS